ANPVYKLGRRLGLWAGVDPEIPNTGIDAPGHIDQRAAFGLKARTNSQMVAEFLDCPAHHLLRLFAVQFDRRFAGFKLVRQVTFSSFHMTSGIPVSRSTSPPLLALY